MHKILFKAAAGSGGRGGSFVFPSFVLEIEAGFVVAARIDCSARRLRRIGVQELKANSLEPLLNRPNVSNRQELQRAIQQVVEGVGRGGGRLGLLVPDPVVRVAILSFESLPDDAREAQALVRWRMKDVLPFAPEEARLAYQVLRRGPESLELLVMAAKDSVVSEYETAVESLNGGSALTLPATAALLPLLSEEESGQLLVHVCSGWVTTVVLERGDVRTWRCRDTSQLLPQDLAEDVAREAARVVAGSRDHLKVDIGRVWICARPPGRPELIPELSRAVPCEVVPLAPSAELDARLPATERAPFARFGATLAGLVSNSEKER